MFQSRTVEELHHDEGPFSASSDLVDGADIGVIQSRRGSCFAAEARESLGVLRQLLGQKFQGHKAAQFEVLGLVDYAHASAANPFDKPVMRDGGAHREFARFVAVLTPLPDE